MKLDSTISRAGAPATTDRRRTTRRTVSYLRFFSPLPGTVLNLSEIGMALESMVEMDIGQEYRFRIRHRTHLFSLAGRVRWCQISRVLSSSNGRTMSLFHAGIEFSSALPDNDLEFLSTSDNGSSQKPSVLQVTPTELATDDS